MELYTLYAGQGNFAVVVGHQEAVVVDTHIPPTDDQHAEIVKAALARIVAGRKVVGLILTGFDSDHADPAGVAWVLRKYQPHWIMYPKYKHFTGCAGEVFRIIKAEDERRERGRAPLARISIRIDQVGTQPLDDLSNEWSFEPFGPHIEDMTSSNNSSLVVKVVPKHDGFTYLVTGDTENARWETMNRIFRDRLRAQVMAAPHHGSKGAINAQTLRHVRPDVVLISAGVKNQYGHPDREAVALYRHHGAEVYSTHVGVSLRTRPGFLWGFNTDTWSVTEEAA